MQKIIFLHEVIIWKHSKMQIISLRVILFFCEKIGFLYTRLQITWTKSTQYSSHLIPMSLLTVRVCTGNSCSERNSKYIITRLEWDKEFYGYGEDVHVESCLCQGRCKEWPTVSFDNDIQIYQNPVKSSDILRKKVAEARKRIKNKSKNYA